jgi:hypothetical protein
MKTIFKLTFTLALLILLEPTIQAQNKAITEDGEEVILYDDGTWTYADGSTIEESIDIPKNPKEFKKSASSSFLLKSRVFDIGFHINPKKWKFSKGENNGDAEYELELKEGDLYGMIITEKIEIPLLSLRSIALENARNASPDIKIVDEEYRTVNGQEVLMLRMDGTLAGIKFSYFGYYYSNEGGTVQFITYTAQSLLDEYKEDCEDLLNGLVVLD